jgi:hypothetical protein
MNISSNGQDNMSSSIASKRTVSEPLSVGAGCGGDIRIRRVDAS